MADSKTANGGNSKTPTATPTPAPAATASGSGGNGGSGAAAAGTTTDVKTPSTATTIPGLVPSGFEGKIPEDDGSGPYEVVHDMMGCYGRLFLSGHLIDADEKQARIDNRAERGVATKAFGQNFFWEIGKKLTVGFMATGGDEVSIRDRNDIRETAELWLNWVFDLPNDKDQLPLSISFDWESCKKDPTTADIRIAIIPAAPDGAPLDTWSYIGTQCTNEKYVARTKPSMQIAMLADRKRWLANVMHEFGHALGFEHEHKHPLKPFKFVDDKVYTSKRYYGVWSKEKIKEQILEPIEAALISRGTGEFYDPYSIMHYDYPREWTDPQMDLPENLALTDLDKASIWRVYSPQVEKGDPLPVNPFADLVASAKAKTELALKNLKEGKDAPPF